MNNNTLNKTYDIGDVNLISRNELTSRNSIKNINVDKFAYFFGVQFKIDDFSFSYVQQKEKYEINEVHNDFLLHFIRGALSLTSMIFIIFLLLSAVNNEEITLVQIVSNIHASIKNVPVYVAIPVILFLFIISYKTTTWFPLWIGAIFAIFFFVKNPSSLMQPFLVSMEDIGKSSPAWGWFLGLIMIYLLKRVFVKAIDTKEISSKSILYIVMKNGYCISETFDNDQDAIHVHQYIANVCNHLVFKGNVISYPTYFHNFYSSSILPPYNRYTIIQIIVERATFFDRFEALNEALGQGQWSGINMAIFSDIARMKIYSSQGKHFAWKYGQWASIKDVLREFKKLVSSLESERLEKIPTYPGINDDGSLEHSNSDRQWKNFAGNYLLISEDEDDEI